MVLGIENLIFALVAVIAFGLWGFLMLMVKRKIEQANQMLGQSREKLKNTQRDIEAEKREALLKIKDELYKKRVDFEQEVKRSRADIDRLHQKVNEKYDAIEKRESAIDELRNEL